MAQRWAAKIVLVIALLALLLPTGAHAEQLDFSPSVATHILDETFPVRVLLSTSESVNAVSAEIRFPKDLLEVVSLSKADSIVSLWVQEPSFSNIAGKVNFEGVILNPGFTGQSARIITVNFKVKGAGNALLTLAEAATLANDGEGTNILKTVGSASFTLLKEGTKVPAPLPLPSKPEPLGPRVVSRTHPDQNEWYQANDGDFSWPVTDDISEALLSYGKRAGTPTVAYSPAISKKNIDDVDDGIWYFNVALRGSRGLTPTTSFRFQIDSAKPEIFEVKEMPRSDMTDPQPHFTFNASDAMSGIEFFDVTIDEKHIGVWPENKGRVYTPTPQGPGKHTILVKAVDRAGNYAVSSADFDIEPIDSVRITEYPKEVESGDIIVIGGDGKPNVGVNVYLERTGDAPIKVIARANAQGTFEIAIDKRLKNGAYSFYAEAEDERGAKSKPTDIYTIRIQPSTIIRIGSLALSFMTIFVPLLGFIFFLVFLIWFLLHRLRRMKKVVRKELVHVEAVVHKSFVDLKKQMKDAAGFLERVKNKRDLSEEEDRLLKQLRSYIDSAEESIDKEVEHLKEDL